MKKLRITIIAMYNQNKNLFDNMVVPEQLDKQLLIDNILLELGEMSVIYNNPYTFPTFLNIWSRRRNYIWTEMYKTLLYKYDPISNYDRWEERVHRDDHKSSLQYAGRFDTTGNYTDNGLDEWSDKTTRTPDLTETTHINEDTSGSDSRKSSGNENTSSSADHDGTNDLSHDNYGFNATVPAKAWEEHTQDHSTDTGSSNTNRSGEELGTSTGTRTSDGTVKDTGTEVTDRSGKDKNSLINMHDDNGTDSHAASEQAVNFEADKSHMYGNIGVTTTQQMIMQQRQVVEFDVMEYIITDFKRQFCLGVR